MAIDKVKTENLIYFMQKACARDSWVDFLEDVGMTTEEAEEVFSEIVRKLGLDGQKLYFRIPF